VDGRRVTLPDGRQVEPEQVLGPARPGVKLVHVGDAGETGNLVEAVAEADTLVIEATYLEQDAEMAQRFGHLTACQAARLAVDAGVKHLVLTHISRRYRERDVLDEAAAIFPDTFVARDFDTYLVKTGECLKMNK
jgi:ribonuclease Z